MFGKQNTPLYETFLNLVEVEGLGKLDTSNVLDLTGMFADARSLKSVDLAGFETENVTTMSAMFYQCSGLSSLDVSSFNTSNVTNMEQMFQRCSSLTTLDLSSFDTSQVSDMTSMLAESDSILSLTLGANFTFNGSEATRQNVLLYIPSASGFDGTWTDGTNVYASNAIPNNTAAKYSPTYIGEPFTITYENLKGGTNPEANPATYIPTTPTITLEGATRTGAAFAGWYDNINFAGHPVTSISMGSTGNKTLYAKWDLETYTITYHLNGGINAASNPVDFTIETSTITLADATRAGYAFEGWYDNSGLTGNAITTINADSLENITLYAKWLASSDLPVDQNVSNDGSSQMPSTGDGSPLWASLIVALSFLSVSGVAAYKKGSKS